MTKEITKAYILQQIQDKFKLRELEPEVFAFSERVIPTYNIAQHLGKWEIKQYTQSVTAATSYVFFTVPENERWSLRGYQYIFYSVGAYQVSGMHLKRSVTAGDYIYLDLEANHAVSYIVNLPQIVVVQPGDSLRVLIDTFVSIADLQVMLDVNVEVLR